MRTNTPHSGSVAVARQANHRPRAVWLVLAGVVGVVLGMIGVGGDLRALAGAVMATVGCLVAVADVRTRRVPDRYLVAGLAAGALLAVAVELLHGGRPGAGMLLGAVLAASPLLMLHLVSPATVGFGDVKFAGITGLLLGIVNPHLASLALLFACVLALIGVAIRIWRPTSIPLACCLAFAATAVVALGDAWSSTGGS